MIVVRCPNSVTVSMECSLERRAVREVIVLEGNVYRGDGDHPVGERHEEKQQDLNRMAGALRQWRDSMTLAGRSPGSCHVRGQSSGSTAVFASGDVSSKPGGEIT